MNRNNRTPLPSGQTALQLNFGTVLNAGVALSGVLPNKGT